MKKRILITGANSYIGDSVRDFLSHYSDSYVVAVKDAVGWVPSVSDFENVDVVFNVAGIAHVKETKENRGLYYEINRDLSIAIAKAAKEAGVKQLILLSTMSVYGKLIGHITKDTKPNPISAYGKSKLEADEAIEELSKEAKGGFVFTCIRPPMVYGRECKGNYQLLRSFAIRFPFFPDYRNQRSMVYIGNLCWFVKDCIDREREGLFFPQNSEYVNTSDMVKLIADNNSKTIRMTKLFNIFIRLGKRVNVIKKVFGDLTYEKVDIVDRYDFYSTIMNTERGCGDSNAHKMRILATCQYGWPEPYPSLYPMEEMAKRGHYVHCITGTPNYPMGEVFKGYEHNKNREEDHNGIHITHVPVVARKHDPFHRLLNYHSYPITAKRKVRSLNGDYDVVFANQSSPVMMVEPAITYARKNHKKVVMYCMDLWPASLCVGGVKRDSLMYKLYWIISKRIYTNVDVILITSRMFKNYFTQEFGIPEEKIIYLPQYALSEFDSIPLCDKKDTVDFVFAGNVGKAQNLDVVLRAAKIAQDEKIEDCGKKVMFHIVGNGQELENLQKYALDNKIENVVFHGRKPPEDMARYYAMADAMVVTMLPDPIVSLTLPAKIQSYMAAGKIIIASANGEIKSVIEEAGCGFCAIADNERDFIDKIKMFIASDEKAKMSLQARKYYEDNFRVDIVMDKLEEVLMSYRR